MKSPRVSTKSEIEKLCDTYVRLIRLKRIVQFAKQCAENDIQLLPFQADPVARYERLKESFVGQLCKLEISLGNDFIERLLRNIYERNFKLDNDSYTEYLQAERLGCYACKHFMATESLSESNVNNWCKRYRNMPPLFQPLPCPAFVKEEN